MASCKSLERPLEAGDYRVHLHDFYCEKDSKKRDLDVRVHVDPNGILVQACDSTGTVIASSYVELWCGKLQNHAWDLERELGFHDPITTHLLEYKDIWNEQGERVIHGQAVEGFREEWT